MKEDWITVKECADLAGIKPQSIYKKLNHKTAGEIFGDHVKVINGVKYLDSEAVAIILKRFKKKSKPDSAFLELEEIMKQLDKPTQQKVLNFAKNALELSKY